MLWALGLPSFDTVIHNHRNSFLCVWSKHSNDMVKLLRCMCVRLHFYEFTVFYCTSCIAFFFLLPILSICLSVCLLFMFMGLAVWFQQDAQLSQRDRATRCVIVLPKVEDWNWETIFYRHYMSILSHCDIIGLKICRIRWKKTQNKGYYGVQGHWRSSRSVPIENPYATSY